MAHAQRQESAAPARRRAERLEARVTAEQKALIEHAAALEGRSITDFVLTSVQDAAKRAIAEHEVIQLSVRDSKAFVDALLNPRALLQRLAAVRGRLSLCADQAAAAKWWLSMPMASVSAEGPMPKALSTRRTSPLMPGCRHQGRACPLRRARMTSNPLIVA